MHALRLPPDASPAFRCPSCTAYPVRAGRFVSPFRRTPGGVGAAPPGLALVCPARPVRGLRRERRRLSQVSGEPLVSLPCSWTPPEGRALPRAGAPGRSPFSDRESLPELSLSWLDHTASTPAAYASRCDCSARARLASGCRAGCCRTGFGLRLHPQGSSREFQLTGPWSLSSSFRAGLRLALLKPRAVWPSARQRLALQRRGTLQNTPGSSAFWRASGLASRFSPTKSRSTWKGSPEAWRRWANARGSGRPAATEAPSPRNPRSLGGYLARNCRLRKHRRPSPRAMPAARGGGGRRQSRAPRWPLPGGCTPPPACWPWHLSPCPHPDVC